MNGHVKKVSLLAVCTSLAMVLSYFELLLPPLMPAVPGVKLGLANIVVIFVLFRFGVRSAVGISALRVTLCALLFGNALTLAYSISGAVLSLAVMALFKKTGLFSVVGISVLGGVFHNVGQVIAAILLMRSAEISYYLPVLAITGVISGIFIGLVGAVVLKSLENVKI